MKFILLLTFFNFCSFFAMQKLPLDIIAFIAAQPGTIIIKKPNLKNSTVAVQKTLLQKFNNLYKQFIPAIHLLLTCKSYYNDDLKLKVKYFLMNRSIPQGLLIHVCPIYMRYEVFVENENYEKIINLSGALIDICVQKTPITDNQIHQKIVDSGLSPDQLNFIVYSAFLNNAISRTLIEYLYFAIKYTETALMETSIKNIFLIIEYLCKEKKLILNYLLKKTTPSRLNNISLNCIQIMQITLQMYHYLALKSFLKIGTLKVFMKDHMKIQLLLVK